MTEERLTLQRYKFAALMDIDPEMRERCAIPGKWEASTIPEFARDVLQVRVTQEIFGKQVALVEEAWPADWWQAVKERFAPAWFVCRWPVRQKTIRIDVKALFPLIDAPRDVRFQHVPWVDVRRECP